MASHPALGGTGPELAVDLSRVVGAVLLFEAVQLPSLAPDQHLHPTDFRSAEEAQNGRARARIGSASADAVVHSVVRGS